MKRSHVNLLAATVCLALLMGSLLYSLGHASQDLEKSLDIKRHANEPLELVDLKVSDQSVKSKIKVKLRRGDDGLDSVAFQDQLDWFKRLSVRLRNVSGKKITGLNAYLYFKPLGSQILFRVALRGPSGQLERAPLDPGAEIHVTVDQGSLERTFDRIRRYGLHDNPAAVTLSIGTVAFSDGLQWRKGHILQRDPDNPHKWKPILLKTAARD